MQRYNMQTGSAEEADHEGPEYESEHGEWVRYVDVEPLIAALREIARPKRGGVEYFDTEQDWVSYWYRACERERETARAALEKSGGTK